MSASLLFAIGGLTSVGVYLITARSLSRIILGFALLGHAAVLALLTAGGPPAASPIIGPETTDISNPVPQALALTAIVISFGLTLFLLALAARQQTLTGDDLVEDDIEDQRIASAAEQPDGEQLSDEQASDGETNDGQTTPPNSVVT
ncbi:MAG: NADH-quinone oxidoreductase subunit K [Acidimicrobiales bacterium]